MYDAAIGVLYRQRDTCFAAAKLVEEDMEGVKAKPGDMTRLLTSLAKQRDKLLFQAECNLPEVLWRHRNNMGDMSQAVYRGLRREDHIQFVVPKLLERSTTMSVIPDVVPSGTRATVGVSLRFPAAEPESIPAAESSKGPPRFVHPGDPVLPSMALVRPAVKLTSFHVEPKLYTLILCDPDDPFPETKSYRTVVHWVRTNIPAQLETDIAADTDNASEDVVPYIPPYPQLGTKYHRYVLLALEQPSTSEAITITAEEFPDRVIDVKNLTERHGLTVCGWSFFRAKWQQGVVEEVYRTRLGLELPRYVRPELAPQPKLKRFSRDQL